MFISFEGIEGSGKSTQLGLLSKQFESESIDYLATREPGGTAVGEGIRALLLHQDLGFSHPLSELYLFHVDRLEHVDLVIEPALSAGKIVLCDRYIDSTFAYQFGGRKLSFELVDSLIKTVDVMPDYTFLFDIDVEEGLRRASSRSELDRFEQESLDFHRRIRKAYLRRALADSDRFMVVSVEKRDQMDIFNEVWGIVQGLLTRRS